MKPQVLRYAIDGGFMITVNGLAAEKEELHRIYFEELEKSNGPAFIIDSPGTVSVQYKTASEYEELRLELYQIRCRAKYVAGSPSA